MMNGTAVERNIALVEKVVRVLRLGIDVLGAINDGKGE